MKREIKQKLKDIKQRVRNVYWWMNGKTLSNPPLPTDPRSVLFVCKGNICRSPFAERLAERIVKTKCCKKITFNSAGLTVSEPSAPPKEAVLTARRFGVKLEDHKSRKINDELMNSADMILVMEPWHLESLKKLFPYSGEKFFLLPLFQKKDSEIKDSYHRYNLSDPYGQPADQFQVCYTRIEECLLELFTKISPSLFSGVNN